MEIEIVAFYPHYVSADQKEVRGTLHIYLVEEQIDIRGVTVHMMKNGKSFVMFGQGWRWVNGVKEFYPYISFGDVNKNDKILEFCRTKGIDHVRMLDLPPNPRKKRSPKRKVYAEKKQDPTSAGRYKTGRPPIQQSNLRTLRNP